ARAGSMSPTTIDSTNSRCDAIAQNASPTPPAPTSRILMAGRLPTTPFCSLFHNVSVVKQRTERGGGAGRGAGPRPSAWGLRGAPGTVAAVARGSVVVVVAPPGPDDPPERLRSIIDRRSSGDPISAAPVGRGSPSTRSSSAVAPSRSSRYTAADASSSRALPLSGST